MSHDCKNVAMGVWIVVWSDKDHSIVFEEIVFNDFFVDFDAHAKTNFPIFIIDGICKKQ